MFPLPLSKMLGEKPFLLVYLKNKQGNRNQEFLFCGGREQSEAEGLVCRVGRAIKNNRILNSNCWLEMRPDLVRKA